MRNWPTKKLGELIEERKEKNKQNEKLKVFAISNLYGFIPSEEFFYKRVYSKVLTNYKKVYKYDFAYNPARANVGSIGIYEKDKPCLVSPMYLVFRVKNIDQLYPLFLFKVLKSSLFINRIKALSASQGSIRQILKFEDFCSLEISLPPLPIQQKIVSILDTIQEAINIQNKIIETTKELKKSMMADLFKYGLPSFRKSRKLKKTEIGEIPEDWEVVKLGEVVRINYGIQAPVSQLKDKSIGIPILTNKNITEDGNIILTELNYYPLEKEKYEKYLLKKGDLIFNWRSGSIEHVGKVALFNLDGKFTFSSFLLKFSTSSKVIPLFLKEYLNWVRKLGILKMYAQQASINQSLNASIMNEFQIPLPPLPEQREIADILQTIDQKIEIEQKKKALYEELFKTILNKLMSGEIDVEKIEI